MDHFLLNITLYILFTFLSFNTYSTICKRDKRTTSSNSMTVTSVLLLSTYSSHLLSDLTTCEVSSFIISVDSPLPHPSGHFLVVASSSTLNLRATSDGVLTSCSKFNVSKLISHFRVTGFHRHPFCDWGESLDLDGPHISPAVNSPIVYFGTRVS